MTSTEPSEMTKHQYLRRLQARILRHGLYRGDVHADDVLADLPVPGNIHPNIVGQAFSGLDSAGLITPSGFRRSERKARHKGISRLWHVCDALGARRYLSALATTGDDCGV